MPTSGHKAAEETYGSIFLHDHGWKAAAGKICAQLSADLPHGMP